MHERQRDTILHFSTLLIFPGPIRFTPSSSPPALVFLSSCLPSILHHICRLLPFFSHLEVQQRHVARVHERDIIPQKDLRHDVDIRPHPRYTMRRKILFASTNASSSKLSDADASAVEASTTALEAVRMPARRRSEDSSGLPSQK